MVIQVLVGDAPDLSWSPIEQSSRMHGTRWRVRRPMNVSNVVNGGLARHKQPGSS